MLSISLVTACSSCAMRGYENNPDHTSNTNSYVVKVFDGNLFNPDFASQRKINQNHSVVPGWTSSSGGGSTLGY